MSYSKRKCLLPKKNSIVFKTESVFPSTVIHQTRFPILQVTGIVIQDQAHMAGPGAMKRAAQLARGRCEGQQWTTWGIKKNWWTFPFLPSLGQHGIYIYIYKYIFEKYISIYI